MRGLGVSRESGRDRQRDREGLGPVRQRRRPGGGRPGAGAGRPRRGEKVESPRTDAKGVSAEGREQPTIEPEVPVTPQAVADAPDTTTPKTQHEDPTKLDQSGEGQAAEKPKRTRKKKES